MRGLFQGLLTQPEYGPQVPDNMRWQYGLPPRQIGFLDPQNAGTMAMIGSLLQASGPQPQKQSLGQIAGQAMGAYGQGKAAQEKMRTEQEAQQIDNYTKRALMNLKEREFTNLSAADKERFAIEREKNQIMRDKITELGGATGGTALLREMKAFGIDPMNATPEQIAYFSSIKRGGVVPAGYAMNNAGQLVPIAGAKEGFSAIEEAKGYGSALGRERGETVGKREAAIPQKAKFSALVTQAENKLGELNAANAIVSSEKGALSNIGNYLAQTDTGQAIGKAIGTKEQVLRSELNSLSESITPLLMSATGLGAKQLDSNVELQAFKAQLGDKSAPLQARVAALRNIEKLYGLSSINGSAQQPQPTTGQSAPPSGWNVRIK